MCVYIISSILVAAEIGMCPEPNDELTGRLRRPGLKFPRPKSFSPGFEAVMSQFTSLIFLTPIMMMRSVIIAAIWLQSPGSGVLAALDVAVYMSTCHFS